MGRSINLRPWGVCDRCGQRFRHSTLREEWTGILACKQCWEPKHPQLTPPQNVAGDPRPVDNARPRGNRLDVEIRRRVWTAVPSVGTLKMALYSTIPEGDTYTTTGEVSATGYTAGGESMTGVALSGGRLTADPVVWSGTITALCALIYDTSAADAIVALVDFSYAQACTEGTFTVRLD